MPIACEYRQFTLILAPGTASRTWLARLAQALGTWALAARYSNPAVTGWIRSVSATAVWTTSACTGALLLHEAGPARGRRVATHSRFRRHAPAGAVIASSVRRWPGDTQHQARHVRSALLSRDLGSSG